MKNSNANSNENVEHQDKSHDDLSSIRKKALINLIVMPIYLLIFVALIFSQWRVSINWLLAPDLKMKIFWFAIGLLLIVVAFVLSRCVRRFSKWVYSKPANGEHNV